MTARPRRTSAGSIVPAVVASTSASQASTAPGTIPGERLLALRAAGVALEEQALERAQLGPAQVGPHGGDPLDRVGGQVAEDAPLAPLYLLHDRQQQLVPRPEVV